MGQPVGPPALSVLILAHNYARFLPACLDSVLAQSFQEFEVIVIDDASTDDTTAVLAKYRCDPRVRVVRHDMNSGFVASLIEGTEALSRGEFLTVISADDLAMDDAAFAAQVTRLRADDRLVACFSAYTKLGPHRTESTRRPRRGDQVIAGADLIYHQLTDREFGILQSGTIIRASAYRQAGGYRTDLKNYVDLAMWLALGEVGPFAYVDRPLYGYRLHANQLSGSAVQRRDVLREGVSLTREATAHAAKRDPRLNISAVLRARIADLALADAFAGRRVRGLERCADASRLEPLAAFSSTGWWIALVRSLAGERAWRAFAAIRRLVRTA